MASAARKRVVVLGGGGFVGSAVAQEALRRGLRVLCLCRSGRSDVPGDWSDRVTWAKADALRAETYREHLRGADAVVISIGSPPLPFVDRAYQLLMNGETNVTATRTAKEEGVRQVVLINAAMPPALTPKGYFDGKRAAELAAREMVGPSFGAAVLKPGGAQSNTQLSLAHCTHASSHAAIYGTRYAGRWPIPLWPFMAPASAVLRRLPSPLLVENAPISVSNVAAAAVDAATNPALQAKFTVWGNQEMFRHMSRTK